VRETLEEDFLPDEAGAASEDNFHGFDEGRKIDVR